MHEEDRRVLLVRHRLGRRVQVEDQGDGLDACREASSRPSAQESAWCRTWCDESRASPDHLSKITVLFILRGLYCWFNPVSSVKLAGCIFQVSTPRDERKQGLLTSPSQGWGYAETHCRSQGKASLLTNQYSPVVIHF